MQSSSELSPKASGLSPFQREIKSVLETIAALEPSAGECLSETALFVMTAKAAILKESRDVIRTSFELLADRGYVRREYIHWRFKRRFGIADVADLIAWNGKWRAPERAEAAENNR